MTLCVPFTMAKETAFFSGCNGYTKKTSAFECTRDLLKKYAAELEILGEMWNKHINRAVIMRKSPGLLISLLLRLIKRSEITTPLHPFIRRILQFIIPDWKFSHPLPVYGDLWAMERLIIWCEIYGEDVTLLGKLRDLYKIFLKLDPLTVSTIIEDVSRNPFAAQGDYLKPSFR